MSVAFDRLRQFDAAGRSAHHGPRRARERLLHLAEHLPERDRWLLEQVYARDVPLSALARAAAGDQPHRTPVERRRLARRLATLVRRLREPAFPLVATRAEFLSRHTRATARQVILQGRTLRDTARRTGRSLHHVRNDVKTVRELARILQNSLTPS